jgi:hypothetical protein
MVVTQVNCSARQMFAEAGVATSMATPSTKVGNPMCRILDGLPGISGRPDGSAAAHSSQLAFDGGAATQVMARP